MRVQAVPGLASSLRSLIDSTIVQASAEQRNTAATAARFAREAIANDPGLSAAMHGLTNPVDVPLGTFLQRVRGTASSAQAQAGRQRGARTNFARRREALRGGR